MLCYARGAFRRGLEAPSTCIVVERPSGEGLGGLPRGHTSRWGHQVQAWVWPPYALVMAIRWTLNLVLLCYGDK
jgi:hypothetical protein